MNERKFAELLKYNVDSLENYFEDVIQKSSLEYSLHRSGIYKTVDMYVECEKSIILIECKKQLKAHDIGQLLTYKVMYGDCIDKEVKLCLAYMNCSKDELKLIRDYIDMYNLNIALIEYKSHTNELSFVNFNKTEKEIKTNSINGTDNTSYWKFAYIILSIIVFGTFIISYISLGLRIDYAIYLSLAMSIILVIIIAILLWLLYILAARY